MRDVQLADARAHPLRDTPRRLASGVRKEDDELFAAVTGDQIRGARNAPREARRDPA
jgi:hypothetical protein